MCSVLFLYLKIVCENIFYVNSADILVGKKNFYLILPNIRLLSNKSLSTEKVSVYVWDWVCKVFVHECLNTYLSICLHCMHNIHSTNRIMFIHTHRCLQMCNECLCVPALLLVWLSVHVFVLVAVFSLVSLSQGALVDILQALRMLNAQLREGDVG